MLVERADFAELADLAAHRQRLWESQSLYVAAHSPLHRRAWGDRAPPRHLDGLADLPLIDKEMLRRSQRDTRSRCDASRATTAMVSGAAPSAGSGARRAGK